MARQKQIAADHGSVRQEFDWRGPLGEIKGRRWCTVSWIRHGPMVSAVAHHHDALGPGATYTGMAHGSIGGPLFAASNPQAAVGVPDAGAADLAWIRACCRLAVLALEDAPRASWEKLPPATVHPWNLAATREADEKRARVERA